MKVLELYSGIGGMHFALKGSSVGETAEVIFATDLNPICNEIYRHNFPNTNLRCRNINSLEAKEVNDLRTDMIVMSPPCQPFTRLGKQEDVRDNRNNSLLHLIEIIPHLTTVTYILMENVKGFEVSETRKKLLDALQRSRFKYEEYLLNPLQFGICNSRLRYYLLAKKATQICQNSNIVNELPPNSKNLTWEHSFPREISNVLEYQPSSKEWEQNSIPNEILTKYFLVSDIVGCDEKRSCCFTRGYARLFEGSGSLVGDISSNQLIDYMQKLRKVYDNDAVREELLKKLKLRHFTPREISRFMCFPQGFSFPEHITKKQQYKVLCNSVNVYVVSVLISYLVNDFYTG